MDPVRLIFTPECEWVCLRELTGLEEQAVAGTTTMDAIRLLDRLLVSMPGAVESGSAAKLTTPDRDLLLAQIYIRTYGPRIEANLHCRDCDEPFDIRFSLEPIVESLEAIAAARDKQQGDPDQTGSGEERIHSDGSFGLADGPRFRLPTGEDECAVLGRSPEEGARILLRRCLVEDGQTDPETPIDSDAIQAAMEALGPAIDLDVDADCSECGSHQVVHFDLQHYLLTALRQEQAQLALEIHRLASAYGWGLNEILELPRGQRRQLVGLVESQHAKRRGTGL